MAKPSPALLVFLAACSGEPAPTPAPDGAAATPGAGASADPAPAVAAPAKGPSLVLVTMDTTRADRLGAYGYDKAHTPNVDKVAAEGVRFERAYAVVPLTTPAHASMMTGLYPTQHGIHTNGDATLTDDATTLAEILDARGYHTAGSVSAFVTTRIWNLDQGFDAYFDQVSADADARDSRWGRERSAGEVVDDLEGWLTEKPKGEAFFVWAHFYDPHDPYEPPKEWAEKLPDRPYDGEIAYMDAQIGRLRTLAEAAAGDEGVAIVLVADHGEAFGEHGEQTHGMYAWDSTMRIPFIAKPPKPLSEPVAVDAVTVSNVDVMPTALGLLGVEVPDGIDGHDVSVFARGAEMERPPVYLESETPWTRFGFHPEWAAALGPWKLFATPNPRLFNVADDPGELNNRFSENETKARELQAFVQEIQANRTDVDNMTASPEMIEQLAALGYVAGIDEGPMDLSDAVDAKDQAELIARVERARRLSRNPKKSKEAIKMLRAILERNPQMNELRMSLSRVLRRVGRFKEAEVVLAEGVERQPQSTLLRSHLAGVLAQQGRLQEAYDLVRTLNEQVPGDDLARFAMIRYLKELDREREALALGRSWLVEDPNNPGLQALVGELEVLYADREAGEALLRKSLEDDIPRSEVHRTLARLAFARGDIEGAIDGLEAEALWFPRRQDIRLELGNALMKVKRWDDAAAEYAVLTRMAPTRPEPRRLWAQAVFNSGDYEAAAEVLAPAIKDFADDPWVLLLHANILQKLGQEEEAIVAFEEAKRLHDALREAIEAEQGIPVLEQPTAEDLDLPGMEDY